MLINIFLIVWIFVATHGQEKPTSSCTKPKPFKTRFDTCANFTEICLKKDDVDCNNLLSACQDCPTPNITALMLKEINERLSSGQKDLESRLEKLNNKFMILVVFLIAFSVLFIILLIVEIRYKLITKCCETQFKKGQKRHYRNQKKKKYDNEYLMNNADGIEKLSEYIPKIEAKLASMDDRIKFVSSINNKLDSIEEKIDTQHSKIKFSLKNYPSIVRNLKDNDTVVKVKKEICLEWFRNDSNVYKKMKLKYEGKILDDNHSLLSHINRGNNDVQCEIDDSIDPNNIVVLELSIFENVGQPFQIAKSETIDHLKALVRASFSLSDVVLYDSRNNSLTELDGNSQIIDNNFKDFDKIVVVKREELTVFIKTFFEENATLKIKENHFSNTDSVLTVIETLKSSQKNPCDVELFCNKKYLEKTKYLFQCKVQNRSQIDCCFLKLQNMSGKIQYDKGKFTEGDFSVIFHVEENGQKKMLKRFLMTSNIDQKAFLNELIAFDVTRSTENFVKLFEVYRDESYVFIEMEKMENKSISDFMKNQGKIDDGTIADWTGQILKGLQYLHLQGIIHCDLKPTNILLDSNLKIKISSFGLSTSINEDVKNELMEQFINMDGVTLRYLAPELLNMDPFNESVDVWSLGATLVNIATNLLPYHDKNERDAAASIKRFRSIQYHLPGGRSEKLKDFLKVCLKGDPEERMKVIDLISHPFHSK